MKNSVAILIFAKEAHEESLEKLLAKKNRQNNIKALSKLNAYIKQKTSATKLSVFCSSQFNFSGLNSFGERISEAISLVFQKGYEKVICVGNDCPALLKNDIIRAAELLMNSETVLGPDLNGGAYLMGLSKQSFDGEVFRDLEWQTENMFQSYLSNFSNQSIVFLPSLQDINTFEDLRTYSTLKYFISYLIAIISEIKTFLNQNISNILYQGYTLILRFRGPPVFSFNS
ncbi:DUF2064 domain-containing protein [Lacihabitans sp. LS3-19]|uniref:TIGR04282 family arsenosugar biosynthesis glycosyltransferase n=1 Tax=Lacihabitans sp. LS3-19 TaxID=2487335 RepID=UPI0020CCCE45|nr:DUF2064 domain-containing protein [Lacihabitans sp. LS3-19]MCP9768268.1 DUF2064 domain-containing protein [Lacihabitans sp. LS3-19]